MDITVKLCAFGFALLVNSLAMGASAGATPADPWTLVPALPTACYGDQDDFSEAARARIESLGHDIERQEAINVELANRFRTMDFMEKQKRMSAYMTEHPQEAAKIMEAFQAAGSQAANDSRLQDAEVTVRQRTALDATFSRYRSAYEAALGPYTRKIAVVGEEFTLWDSPRKKPINAEADQEYGKLCAQWWKTGPFLTQLAEYRKALVQGLPKQLEEARLTTTNFAWAGIPAAAYHSTAPMIAVKHYLEWAAEIFGKRDETRSHRH